MIPGSVANPRPTMSLLNGDGGRCLVLQTLEEGVWGRNLWKVSLPLAHPIPVTCFLPVFNRDSFT